MSEQSGGYEQQPKQTPLTTVSNWIVEWLPHRALGVWTVVSTHAIAS